MVVEAKPTTRVCRLCKVEKPIEEYRVVGIWPKWWCKDCERARNRSWHREERAQQLVAEVGVPLKLCPKCNREKPETRDHWYWQARDGLWMSPCRSCRKAYSRSYASGDPEEPIKFRGRADRLKPRVPGEGVLEKRCRRCGVTKPRTEEHWSAVSDGRLYGPCRACRSLSAERRRTRGRRTDPRAHSLPATGVRKVRVGSRWRELLAAANVTPDEHQLAGPRPATRGECVDGPRPCPWVSCEHHLFLDVNESTGSLKLNFPHLEVDELRETCVLDVADRGGETLETVGQLMNLTRERIRQVEVKALFKARRADGWDEE